MFFRALTFPGFRGRCRKPRAQPEVFNIALGTQRMLMHGKNMFDRYYCDPGIYAIIMLVTMRHAKHMQTCMVFKSVLA